MDDTDRDAAVIEGYRRYKYPAAPDQDADMVMKGGITSGVVYPLTVCELAKSYRLRSIGGSSAGGIAAAFAAAAEYARSVAPPAKGGPHTAGDGFRRLAKLPEMLGDSLRSFFQPSPRTRPAFDAFVKAGAKDLSALGRVLGVARVAVRHQWSAALLGAAVVLMPSAWAVTVAAGAPHDRSDWLWLLAAMVPVLPLMLVVAVTVAIVAMARTAVGAVADNHYGLCVGSAGPSPGGGPAPFTDWIHATLNDVAGRSEGKPLTIGDLWGAAAVDQYRKTLCGRDDKAARDRAMRAVDPLIRLEMMTTNVSFCRPVRMPFTDDIYLYCETELAEFFPPRVMKALRAARQLVKGDGRCPTHGDSLRRLPRPPEFPVVLAVRLTLSFPGLISAVPLFGIEHSSGVRRNTRCHFSDGGISSNFPIHFFDVLWPSRPTFGISLGPNHPQREWLPYYFRQAGSTPQPRVRDTTTIGGFYGAIADTVQNWSDEGQSMLPGYYDRIVEVHLRDDEGGLNIGMTRAQILALAVRGAGAGAALKAFDFDAHRWTRYRTAMGELDTAVSLMNDRYDTELPGPRPGYRAFVSAGNRRTNWRVGMVPWTDRLLAFVGRPLAQAAAPHADPAPVDFPGLAPRGNPTLRITPRF